jgi:peptidoglycan hydrolase-like protein with peptidoglycan-binding domain
MTRICNLPALLALAAVTTLPACSMFGGGDSNNTRTRANYPTQSYASAAPNYNESSSAQSARLTPDTIRSVQQTLKQDGMYRSRVDGVWGPGTEAAVRDYQQQHNLNATGRLDQSTLASLNLGGSEQSPNNEQYGGSSPPNYSNPPNNNTNPPNTGTTH